MDGSSWMQWLAREQHCLICQGDWLVLTNVWMSCTTTMHYGWIMINAGVQSNKWTTPSELHANETATLYRWMAHACMCLIIFMRAEMLHECAGIVNCWSLDLWVCEAYPWIYHPRYLFSRNSNGTPELLGILKNFFVHNFSYRVSMLNQFSEKHYSRHLEEGDSWYPFIAFVRLSVCLSQLKGFQNFEK